MIDTLSSFALSLAYFSGAFTILFGALSVWGARRFRFRRFAAHPAPPPVTILKPIKGTDPDMYRNLSSFLSQDYAHFQVLFCIQNPEDPALPVLKRLREDFPQVDMDIIVSKSRIGYNPKVNNLANAYPFAKHEILLISDSDVRVETDFLRRVAAPFADARVGLVTCFYRISHASGLANILEGLSVNAQFLPQGLAAAFLMRLRFAMGAVIAVRRRAFDACGGFQTLGQHLADDFILGQSVVNAGYRLEFSDALVDCVPGSSNLAEHLTHLTRWTRTIRVCRPWGYAGLLLTQGFSLLTAALLLFGPDVATVAAWLAVGLWRVLTLAWIHLAYLSNPGILTQLPFVPLADWLQTGAWLLGFRSRSVLWRGERYQILLGGRLVPRDKRASASTVAVTP
ncbi:MAG: bacteriohopanetetrol glucosamine biosynthesis glycosyltransferase HpnI [Elusimicrobia bacterium]|nr:bacteriohopanetetrol glucosamine biosynthesis glycosyltransferase HpnI [Elusimicrobiota bacterium]